MIDLDNYSVGREKTASHIYINTHGLNKTPTAWIQGPYKAGHLGSCWVALAVWAHFMVHSFVCFSTGLNRQFRPLLDRVGQLDVKSGINLRVGWRTMAYLGLYTWGRSDSLSERNRSLAAHCMLGSDNLGQKCRPRVSHHCIWGHAGLETYPACTSQCGHSSTLSYEAVLHS